jgi:hypothetical protein
MEEYRVETIQWGRRSTAVVAFAAAAVLIGLIISLSGGGMPPPAVLDALSIGSAGSAMVVVIMVYAGFAGPWGQAGRALALSGMTLVLAGDGLQAVATRGSADAGLLWALSFAIRDGIGNGLFFASLLVLGALLWPRHRWLAGLAISNGVLGYLEMAFASRLGVPPHINFLLLVVWFVALGVVWWRTPAPERRNTAMPTEASLTV